MTIPRYRLEKFNARWASEILQWAMSPEELFHWSADRSLPRGDPSIFLRWHSDPDIKPYALICNRQPVAYGELWLEWEERFAEIARLIVSPKHRRKGLATMLLEDLSSKANEAGYERVWVRVLPSNSAARTCYETAGFRQVPEAEQVRLNKGQRYEFIWLQRST